MQINIQGHGIELTPFLRDYAVKKLGKITEFFNNIQKMEIVLDARSNKNDKQSQVAEVSVWASGKKEMHAAIAGEDMYAAIDLVYEEIKKQVVKHKDKHIKEVRRAGKEFKEMVRSGLNYVDENSSDPVVVKSKRFEIRNMSVEEAAAEQEMRGHDFFIFRNVENGQLCVLHSGQVLNHSNLDELHEKEAVSAARAASPSFFAFINAESKQMNVIYKRRSGNFGLIQPNH